MRVHEESSRPRDKRASRLCPSQKGQEITCVILVSVHSALNDKSCELAIKIRQNFEGEREVSGDGESGKMAQWVKHVPYKHKNQSSRLGGGTGHL